MGRETWIYQLNKKVATEKLYSNLVANPSDEQSFYHFYEKTKNKNAIKFETLTTQIEVDIQQISPFQLFQIINWITELEEQKALKKYGIELLYQSSTKSLANGWMLQFGAYCDYFDIPKNSDTPYFGVNIPTKHFVNFINYLFFLMTKIVQQDYLLSKKEQAVYDLILSSNQMNNRFFDLIDRAFKLLENDWKITESQRKKGINAQITTAANMYYAAEAILAECLRIKKIIGTTNTNIIIVDWI